MKTNKTLGVTPSIRAFTLVEMLVVMAITVVLMALLLPSLRAAKERSRIVLCSVNLKQWGYTYTNYATAYKDFLGGVAGFEYRNNMIASTGYLGTGYPPDSGNGSDYWASPWGKSTRELPKFGLIHIGLTECPSKRSSGYVPINSSYNSYHDKSPTQWNSHQNTIDYVVLAGFSNDGISSIKYKYNPEVWPSDYGHSFKHKDPLNPTQFLGDGHDWWYFYKPDNTAANNASKLAYGPVTSLRQLRAARSPLVMDRHFTKFNPRRQFDAYSVSIAGVDLGNVSNHQLLSRGVELSSINNIPVASGSNVLLLDMSVAWTQYSTTDPNANVAFISDYYQTYYLGLNVAPPWATTYDDPGGEGEEM